MKYPHDLRRAAIPPSLFAPSTVLALVMLVTGCSNSIEQTAEYQAACHGPPLHSRAQREEAMDNGLAIHPQYQCIEKAAYAAMEQAEAERAAANAPEVLARKEAEFAEARRRDMAERTRRIEEREARRAAPLPAVDVRKVEINTASEAELARVITIGPVVAAQIVKARKERRFADWADVIDRVNGLGAAQPAVFASVCGLVVDGRSMEGAPPDPVMAAGLYERYGHGE